MKKKTNFLIPQSGYIPREDREKLNGHRAHIIWFTGLSGSGKSTQARLLEREIFQNSVHTMVLDGDNVRQSLSKDLGFTTSDRSENLRRISHVARLMFDAGFVVICAFISPLQSQRKFARNLFPPECFTEVYLDCSVETCAERDPKGLYKKAFSGEITSFTGVSSPYETPKSPEILLKTGVDTPEQDTKILIRHLLDKIKLP